MMGLSTKQVLVVVVGFMVSLQALAYDPSITTDFGLVGAGLSGANFTSTALEPIKLPPPAPGLTLVPSFAAQFPGLTGLGMASLYFIAEKGSEVPPHTHPRASELFLVVAGSWSVGFIDTTNTLFSSELVPGDQFIFPQALLHYQLCTGPEVCRGFSAFNSNNPGVAITATSLFAATPPVPSVVLANAFNITTKLVNKIKIGLA